MTLRFHPAAEVEHLDYVAYYESCQAGLGAGYLDEFEQVLAAVIDSPHRFPRLDSAEICRARLQRFPVAILFRESDSGVQIVAVAHRRRRPNYWAARL